MPHLGAINDAEHTKHTHTHTHTDESISTRIASAVHRNNKSNYKIVFVHSITQFVGEN